MLHALMIFDKNKFMIFEYYTDKSLANEIVGHIEEIDGNGTFTRDKRDYYVDSFSPKFNLGLVYSEEELTPTIKENLSEISNKIMEGDKLILRQILDSRTISNFEFVM